MQTIFDTIAFIMIIAKTVSEALGPGRKTSVKALMAAHGIIYFA